jgi:DnaJ-class molecular chaperone
MPHGPAADAKRGDMYALLRVDVPPQLTPEERLLVEQLQRLSTFSPRPNPTGTTP